jgi:translation initiation factor IF-3
MIEIQKILKNFESINDQDILSIKDKIPNLLYCLKFEEIEYDDEKNKLICQKNNKSSKTQLTDFVKLWKDNNIFDEIKPYTRIFFDNGHNYEIKIKDVNQINESNNLIFDLEDTSDVLPKNKINKGIILIDNVPRIIKDIDDDVSKEIKIYDSLEITSIEEALEEANTNGLDLIFMKENKNTIVYKIDDFEQIKYNLKQKIKTNRQKEIEINIELNDDVNKILDELEQFLHYGNKIKINLRLRGRELSKEGIEKAKNKLKEIYYNLGFTEEPNINYQNKILSLTIN